MKYRWLFEYFLILCISLYISYLWFQPVVGDLAWETQEHFDALYSVFLETREKEYVLGDGIDLVGTIWIFDHVYKFFIGENGAFIPDIFAPFGYDWGKHTGFAWNDAILAFPLLFFIPTPGWYNLHILMTLTLGYFGCFVLYKKTGAPWLIAFALSMLSINNDFVRTEIFEGRPTQVYLLFHVIFLISVLEVLKRKCSWKWATIGGISGAGMILVYWFGGVAIGFCSLIAIILMGWGQNYPKRIVQFLWMGACAILIPLLITWRISKEFLFGNPEELFPALADSPAYIIDLGIWEIPIQKFTYMFDIQDLESIYLEAMIPTQFLGVALLFCCNPFGWKRRWGWFVALFIAIGIPLPPALIWDGGWFVSGHALLQSVFPPLLRCSFPERMAVAPILFMGIFCALSCKSLFENIKSPLLRCAMILGISIPLLQIGYHQLPSQAEIPTSHIAPNSMLLEATKKWPGGIIHIPLREGSDYAHIEQMYHKQPIMGGPGMEKLISTEQISYIQNNSFLSALEQLVSSDAGNLPRYQSSDLELLRNDGFRLVYINTKKTKSSAQMFQQFFQHPGLLQKSGLLAIPLPEKTDE
jgi:hypothetical protein